jgi:hypothetical protein
MIAIVPDKHDVVLVRTVANEPTRSPTFMVYSATWPNPGRGIGL